MSFFENTRKPVGFGGKLMVAMVFLWGKRRTFSWLLAVCESSRNTRA